MKLYREIIRDRVPIRIPEEILGGLDVASILRAPKVNYQILLDIIKAPELAHKFAKKCQEWEIERIEHQRDVLGVEADSVWVATSTFQLMSREHAKEFVFPYVQELLDKFRWEHVFWYARPIMHFDPSRHIEDIVEWPIFSRSRLTFEVGYNTDLAKVKEKFGDKICFVGNVNPKTLAFGTSEDVESASRECIRKAAYGGGYVLGAGGDVWGGTPDQNLDAMIRTAEKYGKYRINLIS